MVITMEIYKQIRSLQLQGQSQRQIASTLHISRNTVKKYWNGSSVPWERKEYSRSPGKLTPEVQEFIKACLAEDEAVPSKRQHHTAKRIYDRLVDECGFTGGESTIRRFVQNIRSSTPEVFVPLSFPKGDAMQIDWGEATAYIGREKKTVNIFCARLCYSSAPIAFAYYRQNEESFLDAFVRTFNYYGGVPKRVIFDNARVAVKEGFGVHARKQQGYESLSAHYGFDAVFCNPSSGNEKGLIEGQVGFLRRNIFVPVPKVESLDELNDLIRTRCEAYLKHHIRGKELSVGEMLLAEKPCLYPLPGYAFDAAKRAYGRVDRFSTVRFESNTYSVPVKYCAKEVSIKATPNTVEIYFEGEMIASHDRSYDRNCSVYSLKHYLPLLERKGRAILYAKPVTQNVPKYFLDWLSSQNMSPKQLTETLRRCLSEDYRDVMKEHCIHTPVSEIVDPVTVNPVDLSVYDTFLCRKTGAM